MKITNALTLASIVLSILFYSYIPLYYRSLLYAVSLTIKDLILMVLPFVIFSFLLDVIIKMKTKAVKLLIFFVVFVIVSNFIALTIAYFIGINFLPDVEQFANNGGNVLQPLWMLNVPRLLPTEYAMPLSVVAGIVLIAVFKEKANAINQVFYNISDILLSKIITPIIPIFIAGFIIKIGHDQMLQPVFKHYSYTFLLILLSSAGYSSLVYLILTKKDFFKAVLNMWPALATAFATMSSAITLPLLIVASEKNTKNSHVASAILPPAANFHVMGDAFSITIPFVAIIFTFAGKVLSFSDFLIYAWYFITFRFATVGIPGSGITILTPIFAKLFGFNSEMVALITALYVIFDPLQTVLNIFGNGAFAIFFSKIFKK